MSLDKLGWIPHFTEAFDAFKKSIAKRVTLAHRDESKRLFIYNDDSDTHWSGIVTQVPFDDISVAHQDQAHDPLAFHSGRFSPTQLGWSKLEKEACAVLASAQRSHWLAACPAGFDLFTDHDNLIFLFDPVAVMSDIGQGSLRKVLRWTVRMSAYNYVCIQIRGEQILWADLLTRWTIPLTIRRLVSIPPLPTTFENFSWPTIKSIHASQLSYACECYTPQKCLAFLRDWPDVGPRRGYRPSTTSRGHCSYWNCRKPGTALHGTGFGAPLLVVDNFGRCPPLRALVHSLPIHDGGRNRPSSLRPNTVWIFS